MRERDADAFEGYDGKVKQVEALQAEKRLKRTRQHSGPRDRDADRCQGS